MLRRTLLLCALAAAAPASVWAQTTPAAPAAAAAPAQPELQEFTPSNALEQTFVSAYRNAAMRPVFRRQFLESNVLIVTTSSAPDAPARVLAMRGAEDVALIFTSAALLEARLGPATPRTAMTGRAALTRLRNNPVVVNVGYAPTLTLDPEGIAAFLDIPATPESAGPAQ